MPTAATRADIALLDPLTIKHIFLLEDGREGSFYWKAGDFTTKVSHDPNQGIFVASSVLAVTTGCWVRETMVDSMVSAKWFGPKVVDTLQKAHDYLFASFGAGKVMFDGIYDIDATLTVKGGVRFEGTSIQSSYISGFYHNVNTVKFDSTCLRGSGLKHLTVNGYYNPNVSLVTTNAITVAQNVPVFFDSITSFYGNAALYTQGIDGCSFNSWFNGCVNSVVSNGANWYIRTLFNGNGSFASYTYAFEQGIRYAGATSQENHFTQCDFSGNFAKSVYILGDSAWSISVFDGCVFGSPIDIQIAYWTAFGGCEFGSTSFGLNGSTGGKVSVEGSFGYGVTLNLSGAKFSKAANVNIN